VKVSITLGKTESGDLQLAAEIEATVPGVEPEVAQKLTDQAHQTCPYSRATRGNIEATVTVKTE
ncbi:hypothetical protein LJC45_05320, partial [Alistipes sp. OttesenSCG-928-B03]|nr:hypothetical protein [Alistipes sp. OttesenSCG-928-B03]